MNSRHNSDKIAALFAQLIELLADESSTTPEIPEPRVSPERVLLTAEEAAQRLHIGRTRMFSLIKSGEVDSVQVGRLRRIHPAALDAYARRLQAEQTTNSEERGT